MPKVTGTSGKVVSFQVLGIGETIRQLRMINKDIDGSADLGVVKAGTFVEEEVKGSVAGARAEHRSVDTGHFINDVKFTKISKAQGKVSAPDTPYANALEFGTSRLQPRHHFRNTEIRTKNEVKNIIKKEIKRRII